MGINSTEIRRNFIATTVESRVIKDGAGGHSTFSVIFSASSHRIIARELPNATKEVPDRTGYRFAYMEVLTEIFQQADCIRQHAGSVVGTSRICMLNFKHMFLNCRFP